MVNCWLGLLIFCSRDRIDPDKFYVVLDRWNILFPLPTWEFILLSDSSRNYILFIFFLYTKVFCQDVTVHVR